MIQECWKRVSANCIACVISWSQTKYIYIKQKAVLALKSLLLRFSSPGRKIPTSKISDFPQPLTAIWRNPIYKTLCPLFVDGMQLPQGYTEPLWGGSLLFTRNSWYSLNQSRKDERLRWPWSHPVVLNLCINLVITKYKLKSQYVKLTQLWPLTVNCFKVSSQSYLAGLSKICFLCTYDYTTEISVLIQIQFHNIFTNVPFVIFKSCQ